MTRVPQAGDNDFIQCDGETFFGFTVKACSSHAPLHVRINNHEEYWFCQKHFDFFFHGSKGSEEGAQPKAPENEPDKPKTD